MDQFPSTPHPCSKPRLNVGTQTYTSLGRTLLGTFQGLSRQAYRDDILIDHFDSDKEGNKNVNQQFRGLNYSVDYNME